MSGNIFAKITLKRVFKWIGIVIAAYIGLSVLLTLLYKVVNPPITFLMVQRCVQQAFDDKREVRLKKQWVDFEEISPNMVKAVMAAEDNRFKKHNGFDFEQIRRAAEDAKRTGKKPRGASTISQQTAKNVFLCNARNYLRKGLEVYQTVLIEAFWSKKRIMEVYLNVIEFGDGIYGVEAASQYYFGHSANSLSKREAALLASVLPNPLKRNPAKPSKSLNRKANRVMYLINKVGSANLE